MLMSELPASATLVSPGCWSDPVGRSKYYVDPNDSTLLTARSWTVEEINSYVQAQATKIQNAKATKEAIASRVDTLRSAVTQADNIAASETTAANTVAASTPAVNLAYITAMRDQIAGMHNTISTLAQGLSLAMTSVADLASVVSDEI